MTISVAIRIEGQAAGLPYEATPSESVTATLDSVAGVNSVAWTVAGGDDLVSAASYTLTPSGVKGETVTFSMSATAGTALILQAVVNADPMLYARAKVWIPANNGLEVGADGEAYEGDATHGTARIQNEAIRASGVGTDVPQTRLITTTAPLLIDGIASADLSADRTLSIGAATAVATGTVTLGGDLAGTGSTAAAPRTSGINSTTVNAGGGLAVGQVLRATGVSSAEWGALNLADTDAVTGVLPKGNQGVQDMLGDVTGSTAAAVVEKINGTSILTAGGSLLTGSVLRADGAAAADWGQLDLANTDAVTGVLPVGNQAAQVMGGDVTGTTAASVVAKVNATTVSTAGGALATGAVLRVTGAATADWGAVNLADTDAVTGTLPAGNQAAQTMGGDVSGTTAAATVAKVNATTITTAGGALATGKVLRVTGIATADWGAVDLADADAVTGVLPVANVDASSTPTASKVVKTGASNEVGLLYWHADGLSIGQAPSFGGGSLVLGLANRTTAPSTAPTGGIVAYAEAGAAKVWSPKKLKSTLSPETNSAATDQRLDRVHQSLNTTDTTLTTILTYALPTACAAVFRVAITGQQTGTDTRCAYTLDASTGRAAGGAAVDGAPTAVTLVDAIGVAAVPVIVASGNNILVRLQGKAGPTSIDWQIQGVVYLFSV